MEKHQDALIMETTYQRSANVTEMRPFLAAFCSVRFVSRLIVERMAFDSNPYGNDRHEWRSASCILSSFCMTPEMKSACRVPKLAKCDAMASWEHESAQRAALALFSARISFNLRCVFLDDH